MQLALRFDVRSVSPSKCNLVVPGGRKTRLESTHPDSHLPTYNRPLAKQKPSELSLPVGLSLTASAL